MKIPHFLILACAAAIPFFFLVPGTSSAQQEGPAKANKKETREIKVRDGVKLTFEAEFVEHPAEVVTTLSGVISYKGRVYTGVATPPRCILTSGVLEIDGQKIALDVSGLANPWITPEDLGPQDTQVKLWPVPEHKAGKPLPVARAGEVVVIFKKGGAYHHLVRWIFQGGASLRTSVENLPAEWQKSGKTFALETKENPEENPAVPNAPNRDVVISVNKEGEIRINIKTVSVEELGALLKELARFSRRQILTIRADKDTKYESLVRVLNAAHDAGLYHITFAASAP